MPQHLKSQGIAPSRRHVLLGLGASGLAACNPGPLGHVEEPAIAPPTGWRTGPDLPLAVQEIYPTLHAGRIHLAGGFIAEHGQITGPTDAHVVFDTSTGLWTHILPLPTARHHPHLVSAFDSLLVIGGFQSPTPDSAWQMQATGWRFAGGDWTHIPPLPRPVGEAVTAVLGDHVHLAGGRRPVGEANASWTDHVDTDEHFVLTGPDDEWMNAAPLPTARNSAAAAMIGEQWHVVGGRTVDGGNTGVHEVYSAAEDTWRTAAPMPQAQGGLAAASAGGKLYAFGGEYFTPDGGGVFAESWVYDPDADSWSAIEDMPHPRHGLGAVALDGDIYVLGGALAFSGRQTSALVEIYRP